MVLQVVTNGGLYAVPGRTKWYLEGPNGTWKDHDRNLGVQIESIHTKDESKRGTAFAFIFGVN